jgi:hypothetical protein
MRSTRSKPETTLLLACLGLLALALFGPAVGQPAHSHEFADQRALWGVPFGLDVLSNMAFALAGTAGIVRLLALPPRALSNMRRAMSSLFFAGLLLTAAGSSWYHWQPDDAGLAVDRCGMAVAFAGLLGLAAADRISERAGAALGLAALLLGPLAVQTWSATGNVLPWATLQTGGIALVVWMALLPARAFSLHLRWFAVILAYALAKLFELNDAEVFRLTGQLVSGHTFKHILAALAACPVIAAVAAARRARQNGPGARTRRIAAGPFGKGMNVKHRSCQ